MQLAGQLSLYTMRKQKDFEREFARQALADLAEAVLCGCQNSLPTSFDPGHGSRTAGMVL